jgi:hypothetical protein
MPLVVSYFHEDLFHYLKDYLMKKIDSRVKYLSHLPFYSNTPNNNNNNKIWL